MNLRTPAAPSAAVTRGASSLFTSRRPAPPGPVIAEQIRARGRGWYENDEAVAALDPLRFDPYSKSLPGLNAQRDVGSLTALLRRVAATAAALAEPSAAESLAAMRDIGMLLASIKRHGVEPVPLVVGLDRTLVRLGRTVGMIPRETIQHYSIWNPSGSRQRMFTGDRMETMLISAVRLSLPSLSTALGTCCHLKQIPPTDIAFSVAINELASCVGALEHAMNSVLANVSPEFFAHELRPYFDDIEVDGDRYLGPAAAHIPLGLVDLAVWASDRGTPDYQELWHESRRYTLPGWRNHWSQWPKEKSLVTRIQECYESRTNTQITSELKASTEGIARVLHALVTFRAKHLTIAKKSYAEEVRLYSVGSGGGTIDLLEHVTHLTQLNTRIMRATYTAARYAPDSSTPGGRHASPVAHRAVTS